MKRMTDKMAQQMLTFFADRLDIKPIMANRDPDSGYWWEPDCYFNNLVKQQERNYTLVLLEKG